jgi:hypothetical protein
MAKELENILEINGEEYNISAVQADKVANALRIKKHLLTTTNEETFDGSTPDQELDIVPAGGGRFTGKIRVPANENALTTEDVLNYGDLKNRVITELEKNTVLCEWNGEKLIIGGDEESIKSICIITGRDSSVNELAHYVYANKPVSAYIYVDSELGTIYFGTCDSETVTAVKVSAENAINAENAKNAENAINAENAVKIVDPEDDSNCFTYDQLEGFDTLLELLRKRIIEEAKLNSNSAAKLSHILRDTNTSQEGAGDNTIITFKKAERASTADSASLATKAVQDANGKTIHFNYYRTNAAGSSQVSKLITISPELPSGGNDGDIWIKY